MRGYKDKNDTWGELFSTILVGIIVSCVIALLVAYGLKRYYQ